MEDKGPGNVMTPGGMVTPGGAQTTEPQHAAEPEAQSPAQPAPQPPTLPAQPMSPVPPDTQTPQHPEPTLAWTASEYVHGDKSGKWFALALLGDAVITALIYLMTRDVVTAVIVFVALLGLVVFATRKPGVQDYAIDESMLRVGNKTYHLGDFKAFSVLDEGSLMEVSLVPLRRFMPMVTIRVDDAQVDDLVDHLAAFLPMEQRKPDPVDTLLKRLHF